MTQRILLISLLIFLIGCQSAEFKVSIEADKLFIQKSWNEKREIKFVNDRWSLRHEIDGKEIWSPVWTPFEAKYNDNYKFIFTTGGKIFWVSNDKTSVSEVKFIDGSWKFKSEITEEWSSFD